MYVKLYAIIVFFVTIKETNPKKKIINAFRASTVLQLVNLSAGGLKYNIDRSNYNLN